MARDGSGTYTLPGSNPVSTGGTIESSWAIDTTSDIAAALTDSLSRSGSGGMTAPVKCANGTISAPSYSFTNQPSTGWYLNSAGDLRCSIGGADSIQVEAGQVSLYSTSWPRWYNGNYFETLNPELVKIKTADQTNSTTTLADDTHLQQTSLDNGIYHIQMVLGVEDDGGNFNFKLQYSGTADSHFFVVHENTSQNAITLNVAEAITVGSGTAVVVLNGVIKTSSSGTFKLEWAKSSGGTTTTVLENSFMRIHRLSQ